MFFRLCRERGRIWGCERAYARSHPQIRVSITEIPREPEKILLDQESQDAASTRHPDFAIKYASAGGEPAEAFAKGGDSEEHLGGVFVPSPL